LTVSIPGSFRKRDTGIRRTGEQGMARNVLKIPEVVCKGLRDEKNLPALAVPTGVFKIITCKFNQIWVVGDSERNRLVSLGNGGKIYVGAGSATRGGARGEGGEQAARSISGERPTGSGGERTLNGCRNPGTGGASC
jgi:hypothetical protein